jgi:hypothetical protein
MSVHASVEYYWVYEPLQSISEESLFRLLYVFRWRRLTSELLLLGLIKALRFPFSLSKPQTTKCRAHVLSFAKMIGVDIGGPGTCFLVSTSAVDPVQTGLWR